LEPELPEDVRPGLAPLDEEVDHARGSTAGRLILEDGDYECPTPGKRFGRSNTCRSGRRPVGAYVHGQTRCATHSRMAPSPNLLCGVRARTSSLATIVT